ncbi:MAG: D-cysteine desulfhydrase family protein [Polyangiaceae bacterium]
MIVSRLRLANLPTPLQCVPRLGERLGIDLWVKRDDATGGPEAGNKIRKLEYLLADALDREADMVITCGGVQSNHARATATLAARLGLRSLLFLRDTCLSDDDEGRGIPVRRTARSLDGNLLLDCMVGADVRLITAASYRRRHELMEEAAEGARRLGARPYVIPEGGSNGLGALGYVTAMREVRQQLDEASDPPFDLIVHACGSGGTSAGVALGAGLYGVADASWSMAVCDDEPTFEKRIEEIMVEARQLDSELGQPCAWSVDASAKGPAYARSSSEQRDRIIEVARLSGLILDPVYTGKALDGLWRHCASGRLQDKRVLFIHTGGLPGLLAQATVMDENLRQENDE